MKRNILLNQLNAYAKTALITAQEKLFLERFISFITKNPNCFERSNPGHITSSVWIVNAQKTHALLTHHKKLDIWVQLGGHNDGNHECKMVALQEAQEESGITDLAFLHHEIFDIDIHPIPGSCQFHYDIRYLLQAKEDAYAVSDESHDLAWIAFDQIGNYSKEESVHRMNQKFMHFLSFSF